MLPHVTSVGEMEEPAASARLTLSSGRYIQFGPFRVDQQRQEVTLNGSRLRLQGKVYQIFLALLERPGEVVTREELRLRLWPADSHVNYDANVNTTVNKLRQALGDSSDKPLYIETIPRKGYCLLAQPELSGTSAAPSFPRGAPSGESANNSAGISGGFQFSKPNVRIILAVVGLILAGMLLGAGITRLWISPAAFQTPYLLPNVLWSLLDSALL